MLAAAAACAATFAPPASAVPSIEMPRPLRSQFPPGIYHVYARRVDGLPLFLDDHDRGSYDGRLTRAAARYGWKVLCATQVGNHVHMLIETGQPGLSRGVQWLNGGYAQRYNLRYGRRGHVFESRFGSRAIRNERQLRRALLYLLWNPVGAGLVRDPARWRWTRTRYPLRELLALSGRAPTRPSSRGTRAPAEPRRQTASPGRETQSGTAVAGAARAPPSRRGAPRPRR